MVSVKRVALGALAGLSATMIMTMVMRRGYEALPAEDKYPLPPRELTERTGEPSEGISTVIAHFAFGAAAGATFSVMDDRVPAAAFGPIVWLTSYLGWAPLSGRLKPATKHPLSRNLLMFSAHLVWGGCLGIFLRELEVTSATAFGPGKHKDAPQEKGGR